MICSEILCIVSLVKRIIKDFIVKHVLVIIALVSANNLLNIMIKLANKIALQALVKSAAEDGGDKPYSSAEPSFVDRLVMGPLANNVAREAETDGGAGLKAYLYPTLAGAGTAGAAGATGYTALAQRLMRNPEFAGAINSVIDQAYDKMPYYITRQLDKGRSAFSAALHAMNNIDNDAQRLMRKSLVNDNSKAARLYKFLSKNRKWGIPATLAGGALGALGIHNMID